MVDHQGAVIMRGLSQFYCDAEGNDALDNE